MNKCKGCIHDGLCIIQIKDSDFEGNVAGCSVDISKQSTCATCKYYGHSHKRMPCKGCINNGVIHADYHEHFRPNKEAQS